MATSMERLRLRSLWNRLRNEEDGTELIEVALGFPVLLMLTFGILQLLLFLYCYIGATYGGRTALRYASLHGGSSITPCTQTTLQGIVQSYVTFLPSSGVTVTPVWNPNTNKVGNAITLTVKLTYPTGIPIDKLGTLTVTTVAAGTVVQ